MTRDHGHHEPPWTVLANDADEHRTAARFDRFPQTRVGDRYYDQVPDARDLMDTARGGDGDWGES